MGYDLLESAAERSRMQPPRRVRIVSARAWLNACRHICSTRARIATTGALIAQTHDRLNQNATADNHVHARYQQLLRDRDDSRSLFDRKHALLIEGSAASLSISQELVSIGRSALEESQRRIARRAEPSQWRETGGAEPSACTGLMPNAPRQKSAGTSQAQMPDSSFCS